MVSLLVRVHIIIQCHVAETYKEACILMHNLTLVLIIMLKIFLGELRKSINFVQCYSGIIIMVVHVELG